MGNYVDRTSHKDVKITNGFWKDQMDKITTNCTRYIE